MTKNLTTEELTSLNLNITNGAIISVSFTESIIPTYINMVCLGDSNTEGHTTWFPNSSRYPDLFGTNDGVTTFNKGLTSLATSDIIADLENTLYPNKDITKRNIATVLVGTNDFFFEKTVATVWADFQTLITNIKNDGWELIIFTYPVTNGETTKNDDIRELNTLIKNNAISLGYDVLDIHADFLSTTDIDQNKAGYTIADGLHFTESTQALIYDKLNVAFNITPPAPPAGNTYAVWNSADKGNVTLTNGDLTAESITDWHAVRSDIGVSEGKHYWEQTVDSGGDSIICGIGNSSAILSFYVGSDASGFGYFGTTGNKTNNGTSAYGTTYTTGDVIGVALDMDNGTLEFFKNNVSQGVAFTGLSGTIYAMTSTIAIITTTNFGDTALTYSPPAGFNAGLYN